MSNSIFNLRFGSYHLIIERDPFRIRFSHNPYHDHARKTARHQWRWLELMEAPWK